MIVTIDDLSTSGELAAIRPQPAEANRAAALSAGAPTARVKKTRQHPVDAPQLRRLRLLIMRALDRSTLLRKWTDR